MRIISLKIDICDTVGNQAWETLNHFAEIADCGFGHQYGSSGPCRHPPDRPHPPGEWRGAFVKVDPFLAEFALPHYLDQQRVLDAEILPE